MFLVVHVSCICPLLLTLFSIRDSPPLFILSFLPSSPHAYTNTTTEDGVFNSATCSSRQYFRVPANTPCSPLLLCLLHLFLWLVHFYTRFLTTANMRFVLKVIYTGSKLAGSLSALQQNEMLLSPNPSVVFFSVTTTFWKRPTAINFGCRAFAHQFYCLRQCTSKRGCQSVRQASSHSNRDIHFGFFVSSTRVQSVGRTTGLKIGSGRMVVQAAADILVDGSNTATANTATAQPQASTHQDSNHQPKNLRLGAIPFDQGWM